MFHFPYFAHQVSPSAHRFVRVPAGEHQLYVLGHAGEEAERLVQAEQAELERHVEFVEDDQVVRAAFQRPARGGQPFFRGF
jgi:hypothetical protein